MELNIKFDEKMIVETANKVLDEFEYNGKTIREWADLIANPKTNADRIRSMTDEELATNFWMFTCVHAFDSEVKCKDNGCKDCWLRWLREEAK